MDRNRWLYFSFYFSPKCVCSENIWFKLSAALDSSDWSKYIYTTHIILAVRRRARGNVICDTAKRVVNSPSWNPQQQQRHAYTRIMRVRMPVATAQAQSSTRGFQLVALTHARRPNWVCSGIERGVRAPLNAARYFCRGFRSLIASYFI